MLGCPRQLLHIRKTAATPPASLRAPAAARMIHTRIRLRPILFIAFGQDNRHTNRARQKSSQRSNNEQPPSYRISSMAEKTHFHGSLKGE
jgi:hypothetical protein